jgi:hypothetical protein
VVADDYIAEFVLYANKNESGFIIVGVLGKDMNPNAVTTLIQLLQKLNINVEQMKPLENMFKN